MKITSNTRYVRVGGGFNIGDVVNVVSIDDMMHSDAVQIKGDRIFDADTVLKVTVRRGPVKHMRTLHTLDKNRLISLSKQKLKMKILDRDDTRAANIHLEILDYRRGMFVTERLWMFEELLEQTYEDMNIQF